MNLEEKTRLAVALLPGPGARHLERGAFLVLLLIGAAQFLVRDLQLPLGLALIVVAGYGAVLLRRVRIASRDGLALLERGDPDAAAAVYFEVLQRYLLPPSWRASLGLSLGTCALMGGHADRSIVLLRAVEACRALPNAHAPTLAARLALNLLALDRVADARVMVNKLRGDGGIDRRELAGIELLIEALTGSVDAALAAAARVESLRHETRGDQSPRRARHALGWLVNAWAWHRAAAARSGPERERAINQRTAALLRASGIPRTFYAYLSLVAPDFVAFADEHAGPQWAA
ncbi:MAG: hypothetical protein JNL21_32150 [Myxococcales bacterium]|nr:hypothetical protein [Myxococcales bacterium]